MTMQTAISTIWNLDPTLMEHGRASVLAGNSWMYAVRADLAEKYLGTTDPAELAEKFKDLGYHCCYSKRSE